MAQGLGTIRRIGNLIRTPSGGLGNHHEGLGNGFVPSGIRQALVFHHIQRFDDQLGFRLQAVIDGGRTRVKLFDQFKHAITDAGHINTDVFDVVCLGDFTNTAGLVLKVFAVEIIVAIVLLSLNLGGWS